MTIKEIEQILGIPRATVRFYEKQGLICPKRENNTYRDYSEEDLALLKKIIIFRKLGFPVQEIEDILDGSKELPMAVEEQIAGLQKQISELNGVLDICRIIRKRQENLDSFDENFYWREIDREEKEGSGFLDITSDFLQYEKEDIEEALRARDEEGEFRHSRKNVGIKVIALTILCGCMSGVLENFRRSAILKGAFTPVIFVVLLTLFEVPAYICRYKYPKGEKWLQRSGYVIAAIVMLLYMLGFFASVAEELFAGTGQDVSMILPFILGIGFVIWGFIYHILGRRLIFDRRHVTGVSGFYSIVVGGLLTGGVVYTRSVSACVGIVLFILILYQMLNHFVEEKQYSQEERYKKPE